MPLHTVVAVYAAPIPVGHRVEVRLHRRTVTGLFGRSVEERPHEPVIVDLDTGIEYASDHIYVDESTSKRPDEPVKITRTLHGPAYAVLRGVVRACRVLHVRRYSGFDVQTEFDIEATG